VLVSGRLQAADIGKLADRTPAGASGLVRDALQAEIDARPALRAKKLKEAQRQDPDFAPARWHAGMVHIGDKWVNWKQAHLAYQQDERLTRYHELWSHSDSSLASQVRLAKWCAKNHLAEKARFHWRLVLSLNPKHRGALKALDAAWYGGRLMSREGKQRLQIEDAQLQQKHKQWADRAKQWRRSIIKGNDQQREAALKELLAVDDAQAALVIVEVLGHEPIADQRGEKLHRALVDLLGRFETRQSTKLLATYAVVAPSAEIRHAAVYYLKERPLAAYVPNLLSGMKMPLEVGISINENAGGYVNNYSVSREGPRGTYQDTDYTTSRRVGAPRYEQAYRDVITPGYDRTIPERIELIPARVGMCRRSNVPAQRVTVPERVQHVRSTSRRVQDGYRSVETPAEYQMKKARQYQQARSDAVQAKQYVDKINRVAEAKNRRIAEILSETTGHKADALPRTWWDWWQQYLDEHPDVRQAAIESGGPFAAFQWNHEPGSFPEGTLVWTASGSKAIQYVHVGDELLSQHPETGELVYKLVTSVVPSSKEIAMREIKIEGKQPLISAPGNFVWATGRGWRMTQDLKPGDLVHGMEGSAKVTENLKSNAHRTYRLVVLDFHTMLIGESGYLVRDATLPPATKQPLPGLLTQK